MPTGHDYRVAAASFRRLADTLEATAPVWSKASLDAALGPSPARVRLDASSNEIIHHVAAAAREYRHLAALSDARAEVCDRYRRELEQYAAARYVDPFASTMGYPAPPAPWCEP